MTLDVKAHLRELLAKATPGEWIHNSYAEVFQHDGGTGGVGCSFECTTPADAALIAAMRNSLPALLDRLERVEKVSKAAREHDDAMRAFAARCDDDDDLPVAEYHRHQSTVAAARASLRAALDDEAPR